MSLFSMSGLVIKWLFHKPYTSRYPFETKPHVANMRGALNIDLSACVYCSLCSKRCPAQAIEVDRANKHWTFDRLRCISCNCCVEVCPKKCLSLSTVHGAPTVTKDRECFS